MNFISAAMLINLDGVILQFSLMIYFSSHAAIVLIFSIIINWLGYADKNSSILKFFFLLSIKYTALPSLCTKIESAFSLLYFLAKQKKLVF